MYQKLRITYFCRYLAPLSLLLVLVVAKSKLLAEYRRKKACEFRKLGICDTARCAAVRKYAYGNLIRFAQREAPSMDPATRKPRSERRRRETLIPAIRVTAAEKAAIEANAEQHGLGTAEFLRRLGLGVVPDSKLDQQAVRELAKVSGDLGRLGNLLKLWLAHQERGSKPQGGDMDSFSIRAFWREVNASHEAVKARIRALG